MHVRYYLRQVYASSFYSLSVNYQQPTKFPENFYLSVQPLRSKLNYREKQYSKRQSLEEQKLITHCIKGSVKAQKLLYDTYANQMFRTCLRYTANYMDAEDVMITAFHKVFKNIEKFEYRGDNSLAKWIKTIMINESLMFLRNSRRFMFEAIDNTHIQIANEKESEIDAEQIYQLIVRLPDGYRTVLNMFVMDGMNHEEISEKLGITVGTSKSQLSRARAMLKEQIIKLECYGQ
jgi:RNA polymerase sigma factor (sigma-70 family)